MRTSVMAICSRYKRIASFVLVGGLVALFGIVQMLFYVDVFYMEKNLANILQTFISLQINFNVNDLWTWGDWRTDNGNYGHRWTRYHVSRLLSALLCQIIFSLLVYLGIHYLIAYAANIVFGFIINYVTSSKYVFKRIGGNTQSA